MKTKYITRLAMIITLAAAVAGPSPAVATPETEAQKVAEKWLGLIDAGKYAEGWKAAAGYFQAAVTEQKCVEAITGARQPLGDLISRKLKSAKYTKALPGAPDGEYVVLQFDTSFTHKKEAVETITPMLDKDGKWKVSGYYIK
jgi:hypothetical protein